MTSLLLPVPHYPDLTSPGLVTPLHATILAAVWGTGGVALLYGACNPLTAALGATNLLLYTAVYTPMKRKTIVNTWMGAVGRYCIDKLTHLIVVLS